MKNGQKKYVTRIRSAFSISKMPRVMAMLPILIVALGATILAQNSNGAPCRIVRSNAETRTSVSSGAADPCGKLAELNGAIALSRPGLHLSTAGLNNDAKS